MTDEKLLALLITDPENGLKTVINQYIGLVYAIVYNKLSKVCTKEDAEECVSDVFLLFYKQISKIDLSIGSIKAYLMIISKRTAIMQYRKAVSRKSAPHKSEIISIDDEANYLDELKSSDDTAEIVAEKETRQELIDAIMALGEPDATIIFRKYFLLETAKQISHRVNLTPNAVTKRLKRSLIKLQTIVGGNLHG